MNDVFCKLDTKKNLLNVELFVEDKDEVENKTSIFGEEVKKSFEEDLENAVYVFHKISKRIVTPIATDGLNSEV